MKKIVYWSAAELTSKTELAIKRAEKEKGRTILVDFKEFIPDIYKYYGLKYKPKTELIAMYEGGQSDISQFLNKKNSMYVFTGFDKYEYMKFTPEHMAYIISVLDFDTAVFDVNAGIYFTDTYVALKYADEINVVMEPNNLSYYINAEMIKFVCDNWKIDKAKMTGLVSGKHADVDSAKEITGIKVKKV